MRRLSDAVAPLIARMTSENDVAARELRRAAVNDTWVRAVREVFRDAAPFVLAHVNAVYVMSAEKGAAVRRFDRPASPSCGVPSSGPVLVVYVDDSMVRSELDNRQELLKMRFRERGENVASLKIVPALRDMRKRHPFAHLAEVEPDSPPKGPDGSRGKAQPSVRAAAPGASLRERGVDSCRVAPPSEDASHAAVHAVENPVVRAALQRAMAACENRDGGK